ncbi:TPA: hypothetical protein L6B33_24120 [Pseudomonas aeruginosa]|uniref:hypothetical protein n=1 Tax=Pseudomonas aeruginosa TaxID=287 RepID=UPI0009363A24|nr:hypothetical protein [Pseudomonas aeruginosa]RCM51478.1 hypothetical protein PA82_03369 [Pseudomonas aeruginosa]HBP5712235.1 hypothetical protein [Pseudomonas aeruginosa]HCT4763198.1 hypothetical protein [Pseudomonas aeruginosa]HDZ6692566.1 hypothetical protein [Pseudomonas aeruginosa]
MEGSPHIGGNGHRVALRDYYENVEISEERLWHLSDEALAVEKVRCEGKLAQARKNIRPPGLALWLISGVIGVGLLFTFSITQKSWLGLLSFIAWTIGAIFFPLRKFMRNAEFERMVIKHYLDRLQLIRLIQRDRA